MRPRDASQFFEQYAGSFDEIYGGGQSAWSRFINRRFRASMRLRFEATLAACQPVADKRVLDVGCGPGHYVAALARLGAGHVLGLDSAPAMIALARERCTRAGVADRCELVCARFECFQSRERFDYVVCIGFLEYVERPGATIAAVMGLCRGTAFFSLPSREGFLAWQRRVRYRFRTPLFMYSRDEVEALFGGTPEVLRFAVHSLARDFFITAEPAPGQAGRDLDSSP